MLISLTDLRCTRTCGSRGISTWRLIASVKGDTGVDGGEGDTSCLGTSYWTTKPRMQAIEIDLRESCMVSYPHEWNGENR